MATCRRSCVAGSKRDSTTFGAPVIRSLLDDRPVHALEIEERRHLLSGLVEQPPRRRARPAPVQRRDPREGLDGAQVLSPSGGCGRVVDTVSTPSRRPAAVRTGQEMNEERRSLPRRVGPLSLQARAWRSAWPVLDARDEQRLSALDHLLGEARSRRVVGPEDRGQRDGHLVLGEPLREGADDPLPQSTAWNAHALRSRKRRSWWSISASVWCSHDSEDGPSSMPRTSRTVVASIIASVEVHDSR